MIAEPPDPFSPVHSQPSNCSFSIPFRYGDIYIERFSAKHSIISTEFGAGGCQSGVNRKRRAQFFAVRKSGGGGSGILLVEAEGSEDSRVGNSVIFSFFSSFLLPFHIRLSRKLAWSFCDRYKSRPRSLPGSCGRILLHNVASRDKCRIAITKSRGQSTALHSVSTDAGSGSVQNYVATKTETR